MKFISIFFVLFITGFSYSQQLRLVESGVEGEISICTNWTEPADEYAVSKCTQYQICFLQLYTTAEPVVVSCQCHIRHSSKHPEYSPNSSFPSWISNGVNMDQNIAEEEARSGCTPQFNLKDKNPEHWVTTIDCGVRYRYLCEDGSIEMRRKR